MGKVVFDPNTISLVLGSVRVIFYGSDQLISPDQAFYTTELDRI